jgi:hypothetical protein
VKKVFLILIFVLIFITGCESEKVVLNNKYYNSNGVFIDIHSSDINKLKNDNYVLYAYNNFCNFTIPCDSIFKEFMDNYSIDFLSINIDEYKKTDFFKKVRYAPTILIISKNKIVAYLDSNSDDDYDKYQDAKAFEKWIKEYIEIK